MSTSYWIEPISAAWSAGPWLNGVPNAPTANAVIGPLSGPAYAVSVAAGSSVSLASLVLDGSQASLDVAGSLQFFGAASLRVQAGTMVLSGRLKGAVIAQPGGAIFYQGGVLDGATFQGQLNLAGPGQTLTVTDGLTMAAYQGGGAVEQPAISIGQGSQLTVAGTMSLNHVTVTIDDAGAAGAGGLVGSGSYAVLTLGSGVVVQDAAAGGDAGASLADGGVYGDQLISNGTILAETSGATVTIGGNSFTNNGTIAEGNGDTLVISAVKFHNVGTLSASDSVTISGTLFTNSGLISIGASGGLTINTITSNTGTIDDLGALYLEGNNTTGWGGGSILVGGAFILDGAIATGNFRSITLDTGVIIINGTIVNTGATLEASSVTPYYFNGTIQGGVVDGDNVAFDLGTLDAVTWRGPLILAAQHFGNFTFEINNGITLTGAAGSGPGAVVIDPDETLQINGQTTLNNATVTLYGVGTPEGVPDPSSTLSGDDLTLGAQLVLQDAVYENDPTDFPPGGNLDGGTIVNDGTILAGTSGGSFVISSTAFTNNGTIVETNGDSLTIDASRFVNTGTIDATDTFSLSFASFSNSGSIEFGSTPFLTWSTITRNTGSIDAPDGLVLTGDNTASWGSGGQISTGLFDLAAGASISSANVSTIAGGTDAYDGTIVNSGATLLASGGHFNAYGLDGSIVGGVIIGNGASFFNGTLSGVTYRGVLIVGFGGNYENIHPFSDVTISNGISLTGAGGTGGGSIEIGEGCNLSLTGSQTLDHATISMAGFGPLFLGPGAPASLGGDTLTLGAHLLLQVTGANDPIDGIASNQINGGTIVNDGTIIAAVAGDTFDIASSVFSNKGTISVSNGDVLTIGPGAWSNFSSGTLAGGSYIIGASTILQLPYQDFVTRLAASLTLNGAGSEVQSDLPALSEQRTLEQTLSAITAAGTLAVLGGRGYVTTNGLTDKGVLSVGGGLFSFGSLATAGAGKLFGNGIIVTTVANGGYIESSGGLLKLVGGATGGTLFADGGSTLELAAITSAASLFDSGTLKLDGNTVSISGKATVATYGTLVGFGTLTASVADQGTIDAKGGLLKLNGSVSAAGSLRIETAAILELAGAASPRVTFAPGAVATLQLDAPARFLGGIAGLAVGDAIKFSNETVSAATVSGSTLTVVGSAGAEMFEVAGALAGTHFAVQPDQHTIKLVGGAAHVSHALPAGPDGGPLFGHG